jgi:hypothetical protein
MYLFAEASGLYIAMYRPETVTDAQVRPYNVGALFYKCKGDVHPRTGHEGLEGE